MNSDKYFANAPDDDYSEMGFYEAYDEVNDEIDEEAYGEPYEDTYGPDGDLPENDFSEEELFDFIDDLNNDESAEVYPAANTPKAKRPASFKVSSAAAERPRKKKGSPLLGIIVALCVIAVIALAVFLALRLIDENKRNRSNAEEDALVAITEEVRSDVAAGNYDLALEKANSIYYTTGYSDEIEEKWDGIREKLIQYVENERGLNEAEARLEEEEAAAAAAAEAEEEPMTLDDYTDWCKEVLAADGYNVVIQDNTYYIGFWKTGFGDRALEAYEYRGENLEAWDAEMETIREFNREVRDSMRFHGFASYSVVFQLLNDINNDLTLCEFNNGVITYNAVH